MKKRYKGLLLMAGLIGIPAFINHMIFEKTKCPLKTKIKEYYYHWRYGDIRYIVMGSGEPLLLVHGIGIGCSLKEWEDCITYLSKHYKVYALDLLGFGNSDKPYISYSSYLYTTLINDFIEDVIGTDTYIAASSDSAQFAVGACSFKPANFKKLLLVSPTGAGSMNHSPYPTSIKCIKRLIESPILGTTIYNFLSSKANCGYFLREHCYYDEEIITKQRINKYHHSAHYKGVHAKLPIAAFLAGYFDMNIEKQLSQIDKPVHIVWGVENDLNPIINFIDIQEINPEITLTKIEETKLLPHSEKPKEFFKACTNFFN